jgi:hypothetical protein
MHGTESGVARAPVANRLVANSIILDEKREGDKGARKGVGGRTVKVIPTANADPANRTLRTRRN